MSKFKIGQRVFFLIGPLDCDEDPEYLEGVITRRYTDDDVIHYPGYECDWKWAGGDVDWCMYDAANVFLDPKTAIEAYLADRASVLYRDAAMLLEDNVVIPNGWGDPTDWRGHSEYKAANTSQLE